MSDLHQSQEVSIKLFSQEEGSQSPVQDSESLFVAEPDSTKTTKLRNAEPRPFKPQQFLFGMALSAGGVGLMLFVAAGALHDVGAGGAISLPATGLCMILGLMLLGGGFGQMAVSSPRFDDTEFQRMLNGDTEDDDDAETGNEPPSSGSKASSSLLNNSNSVNEVGTEARPNQATIPSIAPASNNAVEPKKRTQTDANDSFTSTVLTDVIASQG